MTLNELNQLTHEQLLAELKKCCGSSSWVESMIDFQPYPSIEWLHRISDEIWNELDEADYLEAFSHHPMIGDMASLKAKFTSTANWAGDEQKGSQSADEQTLIALEQGNQAYLDKFGFIFIVCATGKSAQQMLELLKNRLPNDRKTEIRIAASEQNKITHLRIDKLIEHQETGSSQVKSNPEKQSKIETTMNPITTHVLDTAKGNPAAGIGVKLEKLNGNSTIEMASGITDTDGRIMHWDIEKFSDLFEAGNYLITFDVDEYHQGKGFFPRVSIPFKVDDPEQHYHVPLLLSPFSYSTYRGS